MSINKFIILAAILTITACSTTPMVQNNGHIIRQSKIDKIIPQNTTKREVTKLLGSPTTKTLFNEERWLYISSNIEELAFYKPEETKREILQISFNDDETVKEVKILDKQDGKNIIISEDKTPTHGHKLKAIEQILDNFGRFAGTNSNNNKHHP